MEHKMVPTLAVAWQAPSKRLLMFQSSNLFQLAGRMIPLISSQATFGSIRAEVEDFTVLLLKNWA